MGSFLLAWLVGLGLYIAREERATRGVTAIRDPKTGKNTPVTGAAWTPPKPGRLLSISAIYIGLAILAESESARPVAILGAWAYNLAIGIGFAQDIQTQTYRGIQSNPWNPPSAPDNVVFPQGPGNVTTPTSAPAPNPSGGSGGSTVI